MKRKINFKVIFKVFVTCFIFVVSCQSVSFENRDKINTENGIKYYPFDDSTMFRGECDTLMWEGDERHRRVVFEGRVNFGCRNSVIFHADKLIIDYKEGNKLEYFEFIGNVLMKKCNVLIRSQRAFSYNFDIYIEFAENVIVKENDLEFKAEKYRYYFNRRRSDEPLCKSKKFS